MRVIAKAGGLIADLLFQHLGQDGDRVESEFYRLNTHVRGDAFSHDCTVILPEQTVNQRSISATRSWD